MKRLFTFLFVLLTVVTLATTTAYATETTVPADEIWEYSVSQGHDAIITAYKGDAETIVIPDTIDGLRVIGIERCVFENHYNLKSITFPNTLTTIGPFAFKGCVKLESLELPEKLYQVGTQAFYDCKSLSKITVNSKALNNFEQDTFAYAGKENENGVIVEFTDSVTIIPDFMFDSSSDDRYPRVKCVIIGNNVSAIGAAAFAACFNLETVTFVENSDLRSISWSAFADCTRLSDIVLPDKLEKIGDGAFYDCKSLSKITIHSKALDNFEQDTFAYAGKENENGVIVEFTDSVTIIPDFMFDSSSDDRYPRVKCVIIGNNVSAIGAAAFAACFDLETVTFVENSDLRSISWSAFAGCTKLSEIVLPEKLEEVGDSAFYDCQKLESITMSSKKAVFSDDGYTFFNAGKEAPNGITVKFTDNVATIRLTCSILQSLKTTPGSRVWTSVRM